MPDIEWKPPNSKQTKEEPMRWRCIICGYIHEGEQPPYQCPICGAPAKLFERLNDDDSPAGPV
jgi:rubrerythrin